MDHRSCYSTDDEIIKGTRQAYFLKNTNKKLCKSSLLCTTHVKLLI